MKHDQDLSVDRSAWIAGLALAAFVVHLFLRFATSAPAVAVSAPLWIALGAGGVPLLASLARQLFARQFGSDLLAGIAILTSAWLGEYLIAVVVVLMLSGGQALEHYATRRASAVLDTLAKLTPTIAHRRQGESFVDVALSQVAVGDVLVILPHERCPVDGVVERGVSTMDESYVSGEPFLIRKTAGAAVISGATNGDGALTIVTERRAVDSRYERIMAIVRAAETDRPAMRRLGDRLGAWYTPLAVTVALGGWLASGDPGRFLAVLVIATPCPLLLGIPVAIIGAISLAAKRSILIREPAVLERIGTCRTMVFDKTGTLTMGRPALSDIQCLPGFERRAVLGLVASLEGYSKHPLALAVIEASTREGVDHQPVQEVSEKPGEGLRGRVGDRTVRVTSRHALAPDLARQLPPDAGGLECVVLIDAAVAALFTFRDKPRSESRLFVRHLSSLHGMTRVLLVSGDRESEVQYLARTVGITEVHSSQSPEQKVAIVEQETRRQPTLFVGDGINDAPALMAASVGIALGQRHEVTAAAAGAVILDGSLSKVDELMHIARRTRRIALQSAVGGMTLSLCGMALAAAGWLPPLSGAIAQEAIDVAAVLNALRAAMPPARLTDFEDAAHA